MQDMTRGSIARHLIRYAIPMILGNIMQLTYNAADSVIIGKCLGADALAAVSTSNPIMTLMILGASGMGIGSSVIISRFYGEKNTEKLKKEFSTTLIFGACFSLAVFAAGFLLSGHILRWINTPADSFDMALLYLRIIFVGFLFAFQYNILSYSMRAIGDSKTPVMFLGISCAVNILLDLLFVAVLQMGVVGAALATVTSQALSMLLCFWWIDRHIPILRLEKGEWLVDRALLAETIQSGSLTALQQSAQPIGKVLIQSVVNAQGILAIGAFNAVCRVDDFACIPAQSIGSGIMTCTAQNLGAQDLARVRQSLTRGLLVGLGYFPIICVATLLLRSPVMQLLCPNESLAMIEMGVAYLGVKAWFFIMPCSLNAIQGFFRGIGRMAVVLAGTVIQITVRTICVFFWVPRVGITGEAWACFTGWLCLLGFQLLYLARLGREKERSGRKA